MENQEIKQVVMLEEEYKRVTYEQNKLNREIKKIKQSSSWKYSKFARMFIRFKEKIFNRHGDGQPTAQLINENIELKKKLLQQEELLEKLVTTNDSMSTLERQQYLRELKNEGKLVFYLETIVNEREQSRLTSRDALIYIARLYMNEDEQLRDYVYDKVLASLGIEELPEFILRRGLGGQNAPLHEVTSFRASLSMRLRTYQHQEKLPEWILDDKRLAYAFVERLDIPIPNVDENIYTADTIPEREGIVVKPVDGAGARGVYIIHDENDIIDVKQSNKITGWAELHKQMQVDLQTSAVGEDRWLIENIIYENESERLTGRDYKFYCFYGKIGLILEIVRYPEIRHCWWTRDMERMSVGKYDETLFSGLGVSQEELEMVEKLSKEIPAPFIRIDFLRSENGMVFGEFTPKPGNYDEFNEKTDKLLGDMYLEAESHLLQDLLNNKEFTHFKQLEEEMAEV